MLSAATLELILIGIKNAPALLSSALTLAGMFSAGKMTEDDLLGIWRGLTGAVADAEANWRSSQLPR